MSMKIETGFVKADSGNLPEVNIFMVLDYIKNDDRFNDPEVRNAKANLASRQSYGDSAIGYVCIQRDGYLCTLKATICPEHKVRNKPYTVTMIVNEGNITINTVECEDCAASIGGCKHAVAFLMWINRRSEEPSRTEVKCYWKRPILARVADPKQYIAAVDMARDPIAIENRIEIDEDEKKRFFKSVTSIAREKKIDSQITRHLFVIEENKHRSLSLHQLMINYTEEHNNFSSDSFLNYAKKKMTTPLCQEIEELTKTQSDDPLWYEMRYGRITASKIYEATHCQTSNGSLVNQIIGASKVFQSKEMKRGKDLESEVLNEFKKKLKLHFNTCGLFLWPDCPIIGASPDAIGSDFIVEIKCPASENGFDSFIHNGKIRTKPNYQMYCQMLCARKKKGLFCVADPKFEENRKIFPVWLSYNKDFSEIIIKVTEFWKANIYPRLLQSVK